MNRYERELAALELTGERQVLEDMREHYKVALGRVNERIAALAKRDDLSGIRQRRYQEALAEQIGGIVDELGDASNRTLEGYLSDCYEQGFAGTLYNLQKQGIPLAFPLDQSKAARAATVTAGGVKLSSRVYSNADRLKAQVVAEITRGFADASPVAKVAESIATQTDIASDIKRNVKGCADRALRRSMTIARTEKGRVMSDARLDSMRRAKAAGADIVKQWDSTMDSRTRKDHRKLDGQVRELEEPFEVAGRKAMAPHRFGRAEQDINCRCVCLQRARSALEMPKGAESTKWDGESQCFVDLSDAGSYAEFRTAYLIKCAEAEVAKLQRSAARYGKRMADLEAKSYEGIWREAVTVADYAAKADAVPRKRDYFNAHMGEDATKFSALNGLLDEFERDGRAYAAASAKLQEKTKAISAKRREIAELKGEKVKDDPFSQERKDAALWATGKNGGFKAADRYFDPPALKVHAAATKRESESFYRYTQGAGSFNRPLAGFRKPYYESGKGWEPKFYVGPKQVWIDYEGKGDEIRKLTTLVGKSTYDRDVWLQSGQDFGTIEGFLGIEYNTLQAMGDAELQQFVNKTGKIFNFLSTAVNKGGGSIFNEKPMKLNIYAPSGSQMLYASDKGAYGKAENEMILQRGGTYRITRMYWGTDETDGNRRKLFVDMEILVDEGYDLFQQNPKEWKGSKDNCRA